MFLPSLAQNWEKNLWIINIMISLVLREVLKNCLILIKHALKLSIMVGLSTC